MSDAIRVLLVDDHALFADGLQLLLAGDPDIEMVAIAPDAHEALRLCEELRPDVVLMDIELPEIDGIEAMGRIRALHPGMPVVVVSAYQQAETVFRAVEAGAQGFVPKTHAADELISAIKRAVAGDFGLPPDFLGSLTTQIRERDRQAAETDRLRAVITPRELEVLNALAEGRTTLEVARQLGISVFTVRGHVQNLLPKLGVRSMTEAVALAFRARLVEPPPLPH